MVTKVLKTIREHNMLARGESVLCALSGGVDSSVLLDILIEIEEECGITVCAAHLNHMLRGDDAMRDEEFVREKCRRYGIELVCERADINRIAKETGESTELCARNVRYDFLQRTMKALGTSKIATAHNANDNLETVLFNMSRGGGIDGLCGIPAVRGDIIRPLINIPREDIERYASKKNIAFCEDKTNAETVYTRNKIRHIVVPAMLEINPAAVRNMARSSGILREESDFLKEMALKAAQEIQLEENSCSRSGLLEVHRVLFARVCELFASRALKTDNYTLEKRHVDELYELCQKTSPSKSINLPSGLLVRCEYDKLIFEKDAGEPLLSALTLEEGEFSFGRYTVTVKKKEKCGKINNSVNTFYLPYDKIHDGLVLRPRQTGDEIKLLKRPKKSFKKLFIDEHIPKTEREKIPIIAHGEKVLAVFGFGQDERYLPENDKNIIMIEIRCGEIEK